MSFLLLAFSDVSSVMPNKLICSGSFFFSINKPNSSKIISSSEYPFFVGFKIYDAYCYSWRNVAGSSTKSAHSYGLACDINPKENYCYCISSFGTCTIKNPTTGKTDLCYDGWWKPGVDEYSMAEDSSIVRAFYSIGWGWGGNWKSKKDYMHFSYTNN